VKKGDETNYVNVATFVIFQTTHCDSKVYKKIFWKRKFLFIKSTKSNWNQVQFYSCFGEREHRRTNFNKT